jgi:hypothetical protein
MLNAMAPAFVKERILSLYNVMPNVIMTNAIALSVILPSVILQTVVAQYAVEKVKMAMESILVVPGNTYEGEGTVQLTSLN